MRWRILLNICQKTAWLFLLLLGKILRCNRTFSLQLNGEFLVFFLRLQSNRWITLNIIFPGRRIISQNILWWIILLMTIWALVVFLWSLQCSASLHFLHLLDDNVILILDQHGLHLITSDLVSVASLRLFALCFVMVYFGACFWLSCSACVNFLSDVHHFLKLQFHEVEAWFSILVLWLWFIFGNLLFGVVGELF